MSPGVAARQPRELVEILRFQWSPVRQMNLRRKVVAFYRLII